MAIYMSCAFVSYAHAQDFQILDRPACFIVKNDDTQQVFGNIETAPIPGQFSGHRRNFRLDVGESVEVCTKGPLYPGYRLRVELNALIPIFECYTSITQHIVIKRERLADGSYKKDARGQTQWIKCL